MGIPDHLTCLLKNLYAGQEATEPDVQQLTGSELGKEYILSPGLFKLYAEYITGNTGLDESQAGS